MITISGLDDFPTAISALPLADGRSALGCVHFPTPGTAEIAYSAAYLVDAMGHATKIGVSEPYGKDIGCALEAAGTTLRLYVTEPPPGGGGAASKVDRYDFPNVLPAAPPPSTSVDQYARNLAQQVGNALADLRTKLHQV